MVYISEPGFWDMTGEEAVNLRQYLLKDGLILFDDFETTQWDNMAGQMRRVLPEHRGSRSTYWAPESELHWICRNPHNSYTRAEEMPTGPTSSLAPRHTKDTCTAHLCPQCGTDHHVSVEQVLRGDENVTWCHCRACGHSWHPVVQPQAAREW